jgi:hypothetical protein
MSMSGQRRLELERAQAEALRLTLVRQECFALADACEAALREVRDVAVQQLAAAALRALAPHLTQLRQQIEARPDDTRTALTDAAGRLHDAIASAESDARHWAAAQTEAVAEARRAHLIAASTAPGDTQAVSLGREAIERATRGDVAAANELAAAARRAAEVKSAATLDESIRREVVKGLLKTLKVMGFVTVGPQVSDGIVVLEGRLASGRRARFDVSLDGNLGFDLDGYEGRACADDLERVETVLRDQFGVKLGPPQVVWKNPDRISKGARDLPAGSTRKR